MVLCFCLAVCGCMVACRMMHTGTLRIAVVSLTQSYVICVQCCFWCVSLRNLGSEAFYEAASRDPDNCQIITTQRNGLSGVRLLDSRTPDDVLEYLRDVPLQSTSGA